MYNRYIPAEVEYAPVVESVHSEAGPRPHAEPRHVGRPGAQGSAANPLAGLLSGFGGLGGLSGAGQEGLGGVLKSLNLGDIDFGDILILLILIFLLLEGEDYLEVVIALGLLLLMGLGDKGKEKD